MASMIIHQSQMVTLATFEVQVTSSQQVLESLDSPLRLSICLWVACSAKVQLRTQGFLQAILEPQSES